MGSFRSSRAKEALNSAESGGKKMDVMEFLEYEWRKVNKDVGTLCMIYNATGDPITYINSYTWRGFMFDKTEPKHHTQIPNATWHYFLHVGNSTGSTAAAVYRSQYEPGMYCDIIQAWDTPNKGYGSNKTNTEIGDQYLFRIGKPTLHSIKVTMEQRKKYQSTFNKPAYPYTSATNTHAGEQPIFVSVITLNDLEIPASLLK